MGYYRPDADYGRLKAYKLKLDPVELLGGVSLGYFKPEESYQKNLEDNETQDDLYKTDILPVYASNLSDYIQDPIARLLKKHITDPELQADSPEAQIKKLLLK